MIVGAGRYVLNDVIAHNLRIETVEEFIQHIARRMYDIAEQGPHKFLRNIAPMHERSPSGRPFPSEFHKSPFSIRGTSSALNKGGDDYWYKTAVYESKDTYWVRNLTTDEFINESSTKMKLIHSSRASKSTIRCRSRIAVTSVIAVDGSS
ncbi:hypothetical protein EVAR_68444_1 [Eumeta japonica]|uniref:Uncharacterized protein n=1 Tax=Eumeta variegata TaxID=151549 RepID=A0A4C1ZY21_EUMVA|nr:hypothetical protein EVAR_68444_1 [Eumeta japonica]